MSPDIFIKTSICLTKSNMAIQIYYMLSMEMSLSLQMSRQFSVLIISTDKYYRHTLKEPPNAVFISSIISGVFLYTRKIMSLLHTTYIYTNNNNTMSTLQYIVYRLSGQGFQKYRAGSTNKHALIM